MRRHVEEWQGQPENRISQQYTLTSPVHSPTSTFKNCLRADGCINVIGGQTFPKEMKWMMNHNWRACAASPHSNWITKPPTLHIRNQGHKCCSNFRHFLWRLLDSWFFFENSIGLHGVWRKITYNTVLICFILYEFRGNFIIDFTNIGLVAGQLATVASKNVNKCFLKHDLVYLVAVVGEFGSLDCAKVILPAEAGV